MSSGSPRVEITMTNPSRQKLDQSQRPEKSRSAAQRASDANKLEQYAVRTNTARPSDRRPGQSQLQYNHQTGLPPAAGTDPGDKQ